MYRLNAGVMSRGRTRSSTTDMSAASAVGSLMRIRRKHDDKDVTELHHGSFMVYFFMALASSWVVLSRRELPFNNFFPHAGQTQ
jgi:hypothetical protein